MRTTESALQHHFKRWIRTLFAAGLAALLIGSSVALAAKPAEAPRQAVIAVKGLACPFCVYGLQKQLRKLPGAKQVRVELRKGEAVVDFAPGSKVSDQQIQKAVRAAGFTAGKIEWRPAEGKAEASKGGSREGLSTAEFAIEGMRCEYCVANISTALEKQPGVQSAKVDLAKKSATVTYDPERTTPQQLTRAIEAAGSFRATLLPGALNA